MQKKIKGIVPFLLPALGGAIGLIIVSAVYRDFVAIEDGILGMSVFYLVYKLYLSPTRAVKRDSDLSYKFPRDAKYFFTGIPWSIILYLALSRVLDMVVWFSSYKSR